MRQTTLVLGVAERTPAGRTEAGPPDDRPARAILQQGRLQTSCRRASPVADAWAGAGRCSSPVAGALRALGSVDCVRELGTLLDQQRDCGWTYSVLGGLAGCQEASAARTCRRRSHHSHCGHRMCAFSRGVRCY